MATPASKELAQRKARETDIREREKVAKAASRSPLTALERSRLKECEAIVRRGLETFVEVGEALGEIRELRLYREEFGTWELYCESRWRISGRRAGQLISGAEIVEQLVDRVGTRVPIPQTEKQVRPLNRLPSEERAEAWTEAVESSPNGQPTAKHVEEVVKRRNGATPVEVGEPPNLAAELEGADREIRNLTALVESLQASDVAKECTNWAGKFNSLNGRLHQEMTTRAEAEKQAGYQGKLLKQIRETLHVESNKEILPAIADLLR